jgi:hypothetical protein
MTAGQHGAFGRGVLILNWICASLLPLVIVEMAMQLRHLPEEWWRPEGSLPAGQFDLRMMIICPGPVGWLGGWGYLLTLVWVPLAGYRAWRAIRDGVPFQRRERVLLVLIPTLVVVIELILHLTPLKYGYPLL